jgi:hypothetical protein
MEEHAVMFEPYRRGCAASILGELNSPNQAGERIGYKDSSRTYQATPIESANGGRKSKDKLRMNALARLPVSKIDPPQIRSVSYVSVSSK